LDHITYMHHSFQTALPEEGSPMPINSSPSAAANHACAKTGRGADGNPNNPAASRIYFKRQLLAR